MDNTHYWQAFNARDAHADGKFVVAVKTTRIYCRPSCPARHPLPQNVLFFETIQAAQHAGFRACRRCRPDEVSAQAQYVEHVRTYIEAHLDEPLTLDILSAQVHLSPTHLQKLFKHALGVSPKQYADACRVKAMKARLKTGGTVTEAVYAAGFGSTRRVYADQPLGMTPKQFQKGGAQMEIAYTIVDCPLGRMLVAATPKGVCFVGFGAEDQHLERELAGDYAQAALHRDDQQLKAWAQTILLHLRGKQPRLDLPLDVRGTAFQQQVWQALRHIPYGKTRSYGEIAKTLGKPKAARAVGRACATNKVSIVIPCHRAVGSTGALTGYRWGVERKEQLLEDEREGKSNQ